MHSVVAQTVTVAADTEASGRRLIVPLLVGGFCAAIFAAQVSTDVMAIPLAPPQMTRNEVFAFIYFVSFLTTIAHIALWQLFCSGVYACVRLLFRQTFVDYGHIVRASAIAHWPLLLWALAMLIAAYVGPTNPSAANLSRRMTAMTVTRGAAYITALSYLSITLARQIPLAIFDGLLCSFLPAISIYGCLVTSDIAVKAMLRAS